MDILHEEVKWKTYSQTRMYDEYRELIEREYDSIIYLGPSIICKRKQMRRICIGSHVETSDNDRYLVVMVEVVVDAEEDEEMHPTRANTN